MKKQFLKFLTLSLLVVLTVSCSSDPDSYENLLADEKESIANYISRNGINVVNQLPADGAWGANDYYLTPNGVYIHIVDAGETDSAAVYSGQLVFARYYKITLDVVPDTITRLWTATESSDPDNFTYNNTDEAFTGFHDAVKYMKYNNSVAKLIVPSKQGTSEDATNVKAYAYDFKIKLGD